MCFGLYTANPVLHDLTNRWGVCAIGIVASDAALRHLRCTLQVWPRVTLTCGKLFAEICVIAMSPPMFLWASNAPAPLSLASAWTTKGLLKTGKWRISAVVSECFTPKKALFRSGPRYPSRICFFNDVLSGQDNWWFDYCRQIDTNFLTKLTVPNTVRTSFMYWCGEVDNGCASVCSDSNPIGW